MPAAIASRVMRRMCPKTLSAVHVDALLALCKGEGLGYADVPGLRVRREQGRLWFGGETAAEMPERSHPGRDAVHSGGRCKNNLHFNELHARN
ncbi:MAG: TilS substrate-binding domain-containing protein [Oscillospiraceae bacterium]